MTRQQIHVQLNGLVAVHAAVALFPAPPLHANPLLADSSPCPQCEAKPAKQGAAQLAQRVQDAAGISLGPIGLTIGSDLGGGAASMRGRADAIAPGATALVRISVRRSVWWKGWSIGSVRRRK